MNGSKIRVLALDLDGTLTNDEKIVTPRTRAALDAAAAQGVTIVLASGRPTAGILPLAKELGLDKKGGCVLAYNGGKIVDCVTGEALYQVQLGAEFVPELCEFAARQDVAILTYNSEGIVCERDQDVWANKECFTTKLPMIHVDDLASYVDYPICKMLITLDPARRDAVCAAGKEQFAGRIDLYPSSPFFIEAVPLGVAKDRSLAALLEQMELLVDTAQLRLVRRSSTAPLDGMCMVLIIGEDNIICSFDYNLDTNAIYIGDRIYALRSTESAPLSELVSAVCGEV